MVLKWIINGEEVLIEPNTVGMDEEGEEDVGLTEKIIEITTNKFDKLVGLIPHITNRFLASVKNISRPPSEISCEFSLGFNTNGNLVFLSGSAKGTINVQIKWIILPLTVHNVQMNPVESGTNKIH